jgi:putative heme-binding domain-containing protein
MWDPNGHAVGCMAPGGYLVRTDPDGKEWEMFCGGFRNQYDAAFNAEGELFTYDSDMEWDIGTPWYRPTRIYHLVQGGEYGWRSATGKWPAWYPDNLPMTADIGLGSPTGMEFGTGAKFPAKYQRALYACDWAYGKIYAVHLTPDGASYRSTFEPFVTGKPLNVADLEVGPDGALYFVTGGRGTQSRLYRVTYTGSEPTAPAAVQPSEARALRRKLEAWHVKRDPQAVREIWPHLSSADRWIRFAARIALENQPLEAWKERAFYETVPPASLAAMLAMARVAPKSFQPRILETLGRLGAPWDKAGEEEKLDLLRTYQVVFTRMGPPDEASRDRVLKKLDPLYPAVWEPVNRELCQLLVYLDAPKVIDRTLALLAQAGTQQEQLHYVFHLRNVKAGWTIDQRKAFFGWLNQGRTLTGGHSFQGFLRNIRRDTIPLLSDAERKELDPLLAAGYLPPKAGGRAEKIVQVWTMEDLLPEMDQASTGRSFERGRDVFSRAQCLACHRFGNEGGSIGSDLTAVASRFSRRDILESLVLPSKVISDQYQNTLFQLEGGDVVAGRVIRDEPDRLYVRTDPLDDKLTEIPKKNLKAQKPSPVSPMPDGLLNILRKPEIWDLLGYLESGGNPKDPRYPKK